VVVEDEGAVIVVEGTRKLSAGKKNHVLLTARG